MKKLIKSIIKKLYLFIKSKELLRKGVIIESNVDFYKSVFSDSNKIRENTSFRNSKIGFMSYIGWNCILNNIEIGKFCSIAPYTEVIYGTHPLDFVSTHPAFYSTRKQAGISFTEEQLIDEFNYVKGTTRSLIIGNDVWIGYDTKIVEGTKIGDGAVILSGSVVTKDVEPYTIVGGVPAKFIKYRFTEEEIIKLKTICWWDKDLTWLKDNHKLFIDKKDFFNFHEEKK